MKRIFVSLILPVLLLGVVCYGLYHWLQTARADAWVERLLEKVPAAADIGKHALREYAMEAESQEELEAKVQASLAAKANLSRLKEALATFKPLTVDDLPQRVKQREKPATRTSFE